MGEWNQMKIRVVGDTISSWLNDIPMIELKDEKIGQGKVNASNFLKENTKIRDSLLKAIRSEYIVSNAKPSKK